MKICRGEGNLCSGGTLSARGGDLMFSVVHNERKQGASPRQESALALPDRTPVCLRWLRCMFELTIPIILVRAHLSSFPYHQRVSLEKSVPKIICDNEHEVAAIKDGETVELTLFIISPSFFKPNSPSVFNNFSYSLSWWARLSIEWPRFTRDVRRKS